MRYTTIIDIGEYSSLYRNHNVRLVYLHMVLRSGYHDHDRDLIDTSVRALAGAVGLSVSAVRHALRVLQDANLIRREGLLWKVRKYVIEEDISPRAKTRKEERSKERVAAQEEQNRQMNDRLESERREREQMAANNSTSMTIYFEQLVERVRNGDDDSRRLIRRHKDIYLSDCKRVNRQPVDFQNLIS